MTRVEGVSQERSGIGEAVFTTKSAKKHEGTRRFLSPKANRFSYSARPG
jgi:hypothetical protein